MVAEKRLAYLLTGIGLCVRLINLGQHSFWFDEGLEINRALTPWPQLLLLAEGPDPPLYRLILSLFTWLSLSEFVLRLPSAILGTVTIYFLYRWLAMLGQPRLGLIAAGFLAIAPVSIYYSQEVSQYSLVIFLTVMLLISFERAGRYGAIQDWVLLWITSVLALYTYYGLAWLFPILDLRLAWRTWQRRDRERMLGFVTYHVGIIVALAALYYFFLVTQYHFMQQTSLQNNFFRMSWLEIVREFGHRILLLFLRFQTIPFADSAPAPFLIFLGILVLSGMIVLWQRLPGERHLVLTPLLVLLTFYLASGLGFYHFGHRYGLPLLPFLMLFIAAAAWEVAKRRKWAGLAVVALVAITFVYFWPNLRLLPNPWLELPREELRPVVAYVRQQVKPSDFIYVYYGAVPAYTVYQRDFNYPAHLGTWNRHLPPEEKLRQIQDNVGRAPRFWLVMSHIYEREDVELINGLVEATPHQLVDEYRAPNAVAVLFQR